MRDWELERIALDSAVPEHILRSISEVEEFGDWTLQIVWDENYPQLPSPTSMCMHKGRFSDIRHCMNPDIVKTTYGKPFFHMFGHNDDHLGKTFEEKLRTILPAFLELSKDVLKENETRIRMKMELRGWPISDVESFWTRKRGQD